jgi:large subunit ribosomal protein L9
MTTKRKQRNQTLKGKHGGMQLVLTEDIANLGKQGDVVEVKAGYGRNYLVPRGMATVPTAHNLRLLERYKIRVKQAIDSRIADLKALAAQLANMPGITIEANATEDNKLYGSVGVAEIVKGLVAKGMPIDADMIKLEGPIRETGVFAVKLNLGHEIETEVKVAVVKAQEKK